MDPLFSIVERTIVIAGAGGGIGNALAQALLMRGANVVGIDKSARALSTLKEGENCQCIAADILSTQDLERAFADGIAQFGKIDAVVNAAGVLPIATLNDMDEPMFRECIDSNLTGAFLLSKIAARLMDGDARRIVHIASVSSHVANPGYAAYAASKAGLAQMVRVLGRELAPKGITVNALGPALIETALTADYLADADFREKAVRDIPMGRLAEVNDLIAPLVMLLSAGGSFITGQTIFVDGGRTLV